MLTIETSSRYAAEKEYCFHVLFREMLGADYRVVWNEQEQYRISLPNGAHLLIEDHFFGKIEGESYLKEQYLPTRISFFQFEAQNLLLLYGRNVIQSVSASVLPEWHCGIDVFASTFFMLTRWEEYVKDTKDAHGRFPASASAAMQAGFLDRPVVNEWADLLYILLGKLGWKKARPERTYQLSVSCDVDHPRLWWNATDRIKTLGGSLLGRRNFQETRYWLSGKITQRQDPYDVFDEWLLLFREHNIQASFNFLGQRPSSSNCYYPVNHPFVQKTIVKLAEAGHIIGFHPSYEAFDRGDLFESELDSLRRLSPVPVITGRQHYLRFAVPATWQVWETAGMEWDSTLGYSEMEGFRCGICHDFPVFDILQRKMLRLREKPLIAMDVTLAQYRLLSPESALQRLLTLRQQVERHQGEFVLLWHNSSWNTYFWEPWKTVFYQILAT